MSNIKLNADLDTLKRNEQIIDWSVCLGYGDAEYTLELGTTNALDLKVLAKRLSDSYGAKSFSRYVEGSNVAIKFMIDL